MENVSIKARGFNAVEMNDGECVETGLTWCFRPEVDVWFYRLNKRDKDFVFERSDRAAQLLLPSTRCVSCSYTMYGL